MDRKNSISLNGLVVSAFCILYAGWYERCVKHNADERNNGTCFFSKTILESLMCFEDHWISSYFISVIFTSKLSTAHSLLMHWFCTNGPLIIVFVTADIVLQPLGVFLEVGCTAQLAINILLTLLGYIPGIIHAVWVICSKWCKFIRFDYPSPSRSFIQTVWRPLLISLSLWLIGT